MALQRLVINGYGQVELNNVAFRRDGRIEAQCKLDSTDFAAVPAENGMILAVDKINNTIKFADDDTYPVALHYSAEHMPDERKDGLKDFYLPIGSYYPRLGYLSVGDKWTTNCVCYDTDEFTDDETLITALDTLGTTAVYGGISSVGAVKLTKTKPATGPVLRVVQKTTMPDGQLGVKLQVYKD